MTMNCATLSRTSSDQERRDPWLAGDAPPAAGPPAAGKGAARKGAAGKGAVARR
jgi:hypothetical protein